MVIKLGSPTAIGVAAWLRFGFIRSAIAPHRTELRALSFAEIEEARRFEMALRERVRALVLIGDEEGVAV